MQRTSFVMLITVSIIALILIVLITSSKKRRRRSRRASYSDVLKNAYPNLSYGDIFELGFQNAKSLLESMPLYEGNDIEILAFLYRIGQLTVMCVKGNIHEYNSQANSYIDSLLTKEQKKKFLSREGFYHSISYGSKVAGLWSSNEIPPSIQSVPMLRCAVALGDCITNPELMNNYEEAPLLLNGIDYMADFERHFYGDFFRFVHTYCVMLAGREFDPPILEEYES